MGNSKSRPESVSQNFETLLNIFVLNSEGQIERMNYLEEIRPNNVRRRGYQKLLHKIYGWKFNVFGQNISPDIIKDIRNRLILRNKSNNFKNVIIYFDNNETNLVNEIMKSLAEIPYLEGKIYSESEQPLILFISNSDEKNTKYYRNKLNELIDSEKNKYKLDELNITSFKYNRNRFINQLIEELWQDTIYYNRIPSSVLPITETDDNLNFKFKLTTFTFNVLLSGKNGTGKSTLINILQGRKIAYETSSFANATNKINEYLITFDKNRLSENVNISFSYKFIDTLGFSTDKVESELLLNCIKEYNDESIKQKDRIHYILYFVHDSDRSRILSNVIIDFFKFVVQYKIKVIFVINFSDNNSHECLEALNRELHKMLSEDEYNFLIEPNQSNIIELCLKKYGNINPFGLNKLMEKLEQNFFGKKINSIQLEKLKNLPLNSTNMNSKKANEYLNIINKYDIFNDLKSEEDLYVKCIYQAKKSIYYNFFILIGISWIPLPGVDDFLAISIESSLISTIGECFGIKVDLKEIPKIFKDINFGSFKGLMKFIGKLILRVGGFVVDILKLAPPLGYIVGSAMSCGINVASVYTTGEQAIAYFLNRFKNEQQTIYIMNLYKEYNNCIDGFTELKKYFES